MLHKYSFYVVVQKDGSTIIFLDKMKCQMCTTHLRGNRVVTRKSCFTLFIVIILAGKYFDIQVLFIIFCIFLFPILYDNRFMHICMPRISIFYVLYFQNLKNKNIFIRFFLILGMVLI